ncbi:MAG TPA: hypothetical protein PLR06_04905 [Cyclobacteriaceae bacterium]|nr:hypothetical protein [Cyclobacteriaceae bacterium]
MLKRYTFWLWTTSVLQLLTAFVHSLSFLNEPEAKNESEKKLFELLDQYKFDFGAGFHHTMTDFFNALSVSFSLLYLMGGLTTLYLLQKKIPQGIMKGITGIQTLVFGISFLTVLLLTFLPPIIMTGLVFISLSFAYATNHIHFIKLDEN